MKASDNLIVRTDRAEALAVRQRLGAQDFNAGDPRVRCRGGQEQKGGERGGCAVHVLLPALRLRWPEMWRGRSTRSLGLFYMPRFGVAARKACRSCFQNTANPVVRCPRVSSLAGM